MKKRACMVLAPVVLAAANVALSGGEREDAPAVVVAAESGLDSVKKVSGKEAAEARDREAIRKQVPLNIDRLKRCVAQTAVCAEREIPKLLLGLTHAEIESVLGPPQYQLRLAGNHLFYWTLPLASKDPPAAIRVQVSFGPCYYREKGSSKQAVCDASVQ